MIRTVPCFALLLVACASSSGGAGPGPGGASNATGGNAGSNTGGITGSNTGGITGSNTGGSPTSSGGVGGATTGSGGAPQGGSTAHGGAAGGGVSVKCDSPVGPGLPQGAPALVPGTWKAINPAGFPFDPNTSTLGVAVDPCNPAVLYICTGSYDTSIGGLYKSTDAGSNWRRIGHLAPDWTGSDHVEAPLHVRVDPKNTQHLYVVQGVRGREGFYVSTDGGENLTMPASFSNLQTTASLYQYDVYSIAVDPTDFGHLLLSFHGAWGWTDTKWNTSSGVLESKDGGESWIVHEPNGWGTGHAISFLYNPELGIGDANTWLLGTQGGGMLRTTNAGATWTKVTGNGIQHGGGTVYYTHTGDLYASGADHNAKSTDNGATWSVIGPGGGFNAIGGDGQTIYTAPCFGPTPFIVSPETNGVTWTNFNSQQFDMGPFDMTFDPVNRIVYSSNWRAGLFALKLK